MSDPQNELLINKWVTGERRRTAARCGVSAAQALTQAWDDTLEFLFKPLDVQRWFWLSFICFFLGGGASSAAFNWTLGSLPGNAGFESVLRPLRQYVSLHLWLIILTVTL